MISKGCLYHIVRVKDLDSENPPFYLILVVREFTEVFPNELPGIPPEWEIDFWYCLATGYQPHFNSSLSDGFDRIDRVEGLTQRLTR